MKYTDDNVFVNILAPTSCILEYLLCLCKINQGFLGSLYINNFFGVVAELDDAVDKLF